MSESKIFYKLSINDRVVVIKELTRRDGFTHYHYGWGHSGEEGEIKTIGGFFNPMAVLQFVIEQHFDGRPVTIVFLPL